MDEARTQVEFCEALCELLKSGQVSEIIAEAGCAPILVGWSSPGFQRSTTLISFEAYTLHLIRAVTAKS